MDKKNVYLVVLLVASLVGNVYLFMRHSVNDKPYVAPPVVNFVVDNTKYDSLNKILKSIKIKPAKYEKIRDTIYLMDNSGTDSLQQQLLRYYQDNKHRLNPHRFDSL